MTRLLAGAALLALACAASSRAQDAPDVAAPGVAAPDVVVIGTAPLVGSGLDRDKVPGETDVLTGGDIARTGAPDALRALNEQVGGVSLDSASGNPDQPSLLYHGFQASPLQGVSQGLAVYVGGVRFNQAFGDTVNWDLIPSIAIRRIDVEGANPVFGLNALGGSLNVQMKTGFTDSGDDATLHGGSFGRVEGEVEYGVRLGDWGLYVAGRESRGDGWRDLQSSDIQNLYADAGWRRGAADVHLSVTLANSVLNGPGTSPVQLLAADPAAQFTAPNIVANRYAAASLSGTYAFTDALSMQGVAYYGYFLQRVVNGNLASDQPCGDGSGLLCSSPGVPSTTRFGATIPDFLDGGPYSQLDDQTTNTNSYGASVQATSDADVAGMKNHAVLGASFDGARTQFGAAALQGGLSAGRAFVGPGVVIDEPGVNQPVRVAVADAYAGVYASDALSLTSALTLTLSGRFNDAQIDLSDQGGGALSGRHGYRRFNPAAGATYAVASWLTAYAGYSEANRAPTPAELSCAGPADSCSLANFFVGDPNLKQVTSRSVEAGLRGALHPADGSRIGYNLNFFRTDLADDIAFVNTPTLGRAYFANVGGTRRQGFDAGVQLRTARLNAYADWSYVEATYRSGFTESAGSNPAADANGNIAIVPGDRLPGVPAQQIKIGASYDLTDAWTAGGTLLVQSGQRLFGDEANLTPRLPGFATLNLYTGYQVTPRVRLFAMVDDATGARYYTYGTFSPTSSVFLAQAPGAANPRAYSPAAPTAGYGGVKVTF